MARLLLGQMETDLSPAMKDFFAANHYTVQLETSGLRVLESLLRNQYELVVLETSLLSVDGISVVRSFRASGGSTPMLLISYEHSSDELQIGLDAGADGYLARPYQLSDLAAHLRALLRRPTLRNENMLRSGRVSMDTGGGTLTINDIAIHLHPMEFKLLQFLMSHPNQVFSSHALFERVWQKDFGLLEDTVRTHVRTLRQKIDSDGLPSIITTVRGLGYKAEHNHF
jgi:two-component system response regulator MprA